MNYKLLSSQWGITITMNDDNMINHNKTVFKRRSMMHPSSQVAEELHLHDNRVCQPSLLHGLRWVSQLLGWETRLQLIRPCSSRPRCVDEGPDVSHGVVHVEPSDHASAISQPKLYGCKWLGVIHDYANGPRSSRGRWCRSRCCTLIWGRSTTKGSSNTLESWSRPYRFLHEQNKKGHISTGIN